MYVLYQYIYSVCITYFASDRKKAGEPLNHLPKNNKAVPLGTHYDHDVKAISAYQRAK